MIKLAVNVGIKGAEVYYDTMIKHYEGVAFDCECLPNLDLSKYYDELDYEEFKYNFNNKYYGDSYDVVYRSREYADFYFRFLLKMDKPNLIQYFYDRILFFSKGNYSVDPFVKMFWDFSKDENRPDIFHLLLRTAFKHFEKFEVVSFKIQTYAAELGSIDACEYLAYQYISFWPDLLHRTKQYASIALKNGRKNCAMFLGLIEEKNGNIEEAIQYFKIAAECGAYSKYKMGVYSQKICNDEEIGLKYIKDCANSDGFVLAQFKYGKWYFWGHLVKRDYAKAYYYINFAFEKGIKEGIVYLGLFNMFELLPDKPIDYVKAREFFEKAIIYNNCKISAICLSTIYSLGLGVDVSFEKANHYYQLFYDDKSGKDYLTDRIEYLESEDMFLIKEGDFRLVSREEHISNILPGIKDVVLNQLYVFNKP